MRNIRLILANCFQGQSKLGVEQAGNYLLNKLNFPFKNTRVDPHFFNRMNIGCNSVYEYNKRSLINREFPITIGGDHTVSNGSVHASNDYHKNLHVVWIDAHADINTPQTSNSGNLHGMVVASLLGLAEPELVKGENKLKPSQITYVGLRDVEPLEKDIIESHSIVNYPMKDLDNIEEIVSEIKETNKDKPIHISMDIDVLDPSLAPSTGTPVKGGMTLSQINHIIKELSDQTVSFDLVEINPLLGSDEDRETTLKTASEILNNLSTF